MHAETVEDQLTGQNYNNCEHIGVKNMAEAIKPIYYAELDDPDEGLNGIDICTFFNHILD